MAKSENKSSKSVDEKPKAKRTPKAEATTPAVAPKKSTGKVVIAEGKAMNTRRGQRKAGDEITAEEVGGQENLDALVASGALTIS